MLRPSLGNRHAEQGAVAVMVAISMSVLLVVTAMVLDFGVARVDRTANKASADASVAAGLQDIHGTDETIKPWAAVCTALAYLKANSPELALTSGTYTNGAGAAAGSPCATGAAAQNTTCQSGTPSTWARWDGTANAGRLTVQIRNAYTLPDPTFPEDTQLTGDAGASSEGGCDQLAVIIRETSSPGLGSLATSDDLITRVRAVGRTTTGSPGDQAPALIMLERTGCNALTVGSNASSIKVYGSGSAPGSIHVDSSGSACTSGQYIIDAKNFSRHILAQAAVTGSPRLPGVITTVAGTGIAGAKPLQATDGSANTCAETSALACAAATGRGQVGRKVGDGRYLEGIRTAIAAASPYYNAAATPAGYTALNCNLPATSAATLIFVDCPGGVSHGGTTAFPNATSVVFNGSLEIKPAGSLSLPKATQLYVKGEFNASGNLNLNNVLGVTPCATLTAAPAAKFVVGTGAFVATSQASLHLCHTTVIMAASAGAPACPLPASATVNTAPYTNTCAGKIDVGAGADLDWTAPNLIRTVAATASQTNATLEDLAFWTETSTGNSMGGGGASTQTGVFFAPNATFSLGGGSGGAASTAQFFARTLSVSGNATLELRPDPLSFVTLLDPPVKSLVR